MAWTHIRHRVEDYRKWKEGFDSTAEYKRSLGWNGYRLYAIEGDQNHVLVMEEFDTAEHAREFLGSEYLREAMGRAGVSDQPDILDVCCQVYAHSSLMRPCGRPRRRLTWKP
jgi:hypothetical protein